jgi:hypothetical protein
VGLVQDARLLQPATRPPAGGTVPVSTREFWAGWSARSGGRVVVPVLCRGGLKASARTAKDVLPGVNAGASSWLRAGHGQRGNGGQ